jgi:hypothetical protein
MLAALAEVSEPTIKDWDERGFLPEPSNERVGEPSRGRPALSYPDQTPPIVLWLAHHRRFIEGEGGDIAVKLWLWFEGLYTREIDVRALLLARIRRQWDIIRASLPMLGDLDSDEALSELDRENALDMIDTNVTAEGIATGVLDEEQIGQVSLFAGLLGLVSPSQFDNELSSRGKQFEDETSYLNLLVSNEVDESTREQAQEGLSLLIKGGQFRLLHHLLRAGAITDDQLSLLPALWQGITPDMVRDMLPLVSPTILRGADLRTREDVMRMFGYEPLALAMLLSMLALATPTIQYKAEKESPIA